MQATTNERFAAFHNTNEAAEPAQNSLLGEVLMRTATVGIIAVLIAVAYYVATAVVLPH